METPLACFNRRINDDWLLGCSTQTFIDLTQKRLEELSRWESSPTILLREREPAAFLAGFMAACIANCPVFLCNPDWSISEWQQVIEMVQPNLVWGEEGEGNGGDGEDGEDRGDGGERQEVAPNPDTRHLTPDTLSLPPTTYHLSPASLTPDTQHPAPYILIPTGGSSGTIQFAVHTWESLTASVQGFRKYFEVGKVNSFCVLPLYHVSGLMQFLRSFISGGTLVIQPFKKFGLDETININPEDFFLSLVPTQLQRSLDQPNLIPWLTRFQTILLGGAPAWTDLLETARSHQIRLAPTYGMTETASQIATLKPEDFLQGKNSSGQVLPHAQITIRDANGQALDRNQPGIITIQANSLASGYYQPNHSQNNLLTFSATLNSNQITSRNIVSQLSPIAPFGGSGGVRPPVERGNGGKSPDSVAKQPQDHNFPPQIPKTPSEFWTDDLGFLDTEGHLHIIGRNSDKIITGGENVFPTEVEAAIQSTGLVQDVCVIGIPDRHWGQAITAVYIPLAPTTSAATLKTALESKLSKFKQPKHWIPVTKLPRNAQGKINCPQVKEIAQNALIPTSEAKR